MTAVATRDTSRGSGTQTLWQLLEAHGRLCATWQQTRAEADRLAMVACWSLAITAPGHSTIRPGRPAPGVWSRCTPTVLSRHTGQQAHRLAYRGACLGCGWVADDIHLIGQGGENAAVEDAHDHTHPGWRELPLLARPSLPDAPSARARAIAAWRARWEPLLPAGWLAAGGPIRTNRSQHGTRHVPGGAPGGGYDLSASGLTATPEAPGGQLGLF
jgi:hypothetical protein